ncbi:MAG: hypothetical protein RL691_1129, partial [Actinomycetota bacterium]
DATDGCEYANRNEYGQRAKNYADHDIPVGR